MARIPDVTDLGDRPIPQPGAPRVVDQSGEILGAAAQNLGNTLQKINADRVNLARAKASNDLLDHQIAVESKVDDINKRIASGDLDYNNARAQFDKEVQALPAPQVQGLDKEGQLNLERGVTRNTAMAGFKIDHAVDVARKVDFQDQFAGSLDRLGKLAGMPGADIEKINQDAESFAPLAMRSGLPKNVVDKAIQDFKDRNWLNDATQRSMESKDSLPDLKQLEQDLTASDGFYAGKLDTDKRNAVLNSVINSRLQIENRMQHEQDKRDAKAERTLYQIDQQITSGVPATPQMWADWENTVKGTPTASEFKQRLTDETQVQEVLRRPISEQLAFIQSKEAALLGQPAASSPQSNFQRNSAYAAPAPAGGYFTKLSPDDESKFKAWAKTNKVPVDNSATSDYDMRGFWKGLTTGDPHAKTGVDPNDGKLHYSDYWKTPFHQTFSAESKFASNGAPKWNARDQLVLPSGQVVFDDKAQGGGSLRDLANLKRLKGMVEANVKQMQDEPLLFNANRTGQNVAPLDISSLADPSQAQAVQDNMGSRMATLTAMQKELGPQVQVRPLLPQEVQQLTGILDKSTPEQQASIFATLDHALGDVNAYRGVMQQIAPDAPVKALAGMLASKQSHITLENHWFKPDEIASSGDVAKTLLQGENILNASKGQKADDGKPKAGLYLPNESALQTEFQSQVGDAFAGRSKAANDAFQAAKSYYVGRAVQLGKLASDKTDVDSKLVKESVTAVLGSVVDVNGTGKVLAPWGMNEQTFTDRAQAAWLAKAKSMGLSGDRLPDVGLRNQGDGTYYVTQGKNFLYDAHHNPVIIDVTK